MRVPSSNVGMTLCVLQTLISLHLSSALFGDDEYWKAGKKMNCLMERPLTKYKCDGKIHCTDMSDEENCNVCRGRNVFHCNNNRCISEYLRCDGYDDCWDESDEWDCNNWVPKFSDVVDVPTTIEHFDARSYPVIESRDESTILDEIQLKLIAYKTTRPDDALDARTVTFDHMKKVVIYIPGFMTNDLKDGVDLKNALVMGADDVDCIVLADWRKGSYFDHGWQIRTVPWEKPEYYINVATYVLPVVGNLMADFIHVKIPEHVKVHLIGFSLGAHIAGLTGRTLKNNDLRPIDRISGIDPAGPLLEYTLENIQNVNTTNALRKTDAAFVDVIHSCIILGAKQELGHIDIFTESTDCEYPYCIHRKALEVYMASLTTCSQITCPFENFTLDLECNVSDPSYLSSLGYLTDRYTGRGKHKIVFYRNDEGRIMPTGKCSDYLKVELPAKHRICHSTIDCESKPYLSECHIPCTGGMTAKSVCGIEGNNIDDVSSSSFQFKNTGINRMVSWSEVKNDQSCSKPLSCTIEKYVPVQYYVAYKKPNSLDYFYIYQSALGNLITEQMGMYPFSDPESVLGRTLAPIYTAGSSITYIMWNDDIPYDSTGVMKDLRINRAADVTSFGHSKGVIAYHKSGGFLFSHSIPRFPSNPKTKQYEYPLSGYNMGQMAVCVTGQQYNKNIANEIDALLDLMTNFKPQVYASNVLHDDWSIEIRDKIQKIIYPRVRKLGAPVIDNKVYGLPFIRIHSFGQSDGKNFQDIFINLAEHYQTPIFTKSQTNKDSLLPSNCKNSFTVENIKSVHLINGSNVELWGHIKDNSKWIVSRTDERRLVCVGDLNRERNIMARGGMFICIQNEDLYEMYLNNVHFDFHPCRY